jgi:hypothetical protein
MATVFDGMTAEARGQEADFVLYRGLTVHKICIMQNDDGTPIDLSSYTAGEFLVKDSNNSVIISCTVLNGKLTLGGVLGTITIDMTAIETAALPLGKHPHSLRITSPSGVGQSFSGDITITDEAPC